MWTERGPVCGECGGWLYPYSTAKDHVLVCPECDDIIPTASPPYTSSTPPEVPETYHRIRK